MAGDGAVAGWGDNSAGPASVPAGLTGVTAIAAGADHNLALVASRDTTAPTVTVVSPARDASYAVGQAVTAQYTCSDETGGFGLMSCIGRVDGLSVADGAVLPTQPAGGPSLVVTATDNAGNTTPVTVPYAVFAWFGNASGRVEGPPAVNTAVKAGATVPVQFSLNGDDGLATFAVGSPSWKQVACDTFTGAPSDGATPSETSPTTALSYDPTTDQYNFRWKTDKAWTGQCWTLTMQFGANAGDYTGATVAFNFRFNK